MICMFACVLLTVAATSSRNVAWAMRTPTSGTVAVAERLQPLGGQRILHRTI